MNRRSFFSLINRLCITVGITLPLTITSYDPVKQEVVKPKFDNSYLVGYKGGQFLSTGAVYAPYIPLTLTGQEYKLKTKAGLNAVFKQREKRI